MFDLSGLPDELHVGTSSFSSKDWVGPFYPPGTQPADFLRAYADVFNTVEIDATWHALPTERTVEGWYHKTPPGFVFALKVPRVITHDKELLNCEEELSRFLNLMELLGEKLGPLLFQFPYVAKGKDAGEYATGEKFLYRLEAFLPLLPGNGRYVVEIRNERWLSGKLPGMLRERGIALCLPAYFTMPDPDRLLRLTDPVTAPFSYVRFLGHHRRMDEMVKRARLESGKKRSWDEIIVDRTRETVSWAALVGKLLDRKVEVFAFFNNHYAGFAPGSAALFAKQFNRASRGNSS